MNLDIVSPFFGLGGLGMNAVLMVFLYERRKELPRAVSHGLHRLQASGHEIGSLERVVSGGDPPLDKLQRCRGGGAHIGVVVPLRGLIDELHITPVELHHIHQGAGLAVQGIDISTEEARIVPHPAAEGDPAADAQQRAITHHRAPGMPQDLANPFQRRHHQRRPPGAAACLLEQIEIEHLGAVAEVGVVQQPGGVAVVQLAEEDETLEAFRPLRSRA